MSLEDEKTIGELQVMVEELRRSVSVPERGCVTCCHADRNGMAQPKVRDGLKEGQMKEPKLKLDIEPNGDCWLHVVAPSGLKASINLGLRVG